MTDAAVIPLIRGAAGKLDRMERSQLVTVYEQYRTASNEWLRRQVVENNRIDILAAVVLGYKVKPFHLSMMRWQFLHHKSLQLSFRGGGKTTVCTVARSIFYFCKDRDYHLALGSESKTNTAGFLREIKGHFENNEKLIEVFGPFYDPHIVGKWDTYEIDVVGKKHFGKESSVTCTGVDASITSKHFDGGIYDDLAVEENSRTETLREKVKTWYYKTWTPLIKPVSRDKEHVGEEHGLGTRQQPGDIYEHLEENELKGHTQKIPALDENENSPWPEDYPPEFFKEQRRKMGIVLFNAQYQQNVDAMRGEVFAYDECVQIPEKKYPNVEDLKVYMGGDLAVGDKDKHDMFALAVIGILGSIKSDTYSVFLLDYYLDHLRAVRQVPKVIEFYDKWKPLRTGLEVNQYQDIMRQTLKLDAPAGRPGMVVYKIHTSLDKMTRAHKQAHLFENRRVFFKADGVHDRPIDHIVRFPNGRGTKDFWDAFDSALRAAQRKTGRKKRERRKFGVLGG